MTLRKIRNIGIVAHVDAGKTTLSERILLYTGRIRDAGEVHLGTATLDYDETEQKKGITITAATVRCEWDGHVIHLVDTPGHVDFTIEVARSLRVMDGVVVVLDGVAGVEPQTETVWRQARKHRLPALLFVNKLDRPGASFERCLDEASARLGAPVVPIALPIVEEDGVWGVVDLVAERAIVWTDVEGFEFELRPVPRAHAEAVRVARERLVEACAIHQPRLLDDYLAGTLEPDALRSCLRQATVKGQLVPALGGTAFKNRGVQTLLDAVVSFLPSPADRGPVESMGRDACRPPDESAPLAALCFKVTHDRYGALAYVRVYSGTLREGQTVFCSRTGRETRVGRLVRLFAADREAVDAVRAGEVAGIVGGQWVTGDSLSDPAHRICLEPITSPTPVVVRAIEPRTREDRDKMGVAIRRLLIEDPSLQLRSDSETGQTLLAGMGELHLEIAVERLARDHGVGVRVGRPRVAYRETVRARVPHEVKLRKQSGGPGQFAHILIELGPAESGAGLLFADDTVGGSVPKPFVPSVEKGVREAMTRGPLGFPVVDVDVSLVGGSFHPNDSHDCDFQRVGAQAFLEACQLASPVLLEPWMSLEVVVPDASLGDVLGDLASRRGRVLGMQSERGLQRVQAEVPLSETFGYASGLAGLSHGRGSHSLEPLHYEPVPDALVRRALDAA